MKLRSVLVALLASSAMVAGGAGAASANVAWCTSDPPTHVDSEAGANLTVNTSVTVPKPEGKLLNGVSTDAVSSAEPGGTLVTVFVSLPAGISTAQVVSSSSKYHVTATAYGTGGTTVTLYLHLPVG
jgi:hypothetical protein